MRAFLSRLLFVFDGEGGGSGTGAGSGGGAAAGAGGAASGSGAGAGTGSGQGTGSGSAGASGTGTGTGTGTGAGVGAAGAGSGAAAGAAAAAARKFEYEQEYGGRGNWIPPHRLSQVAQENERLRAMLEAGTGVRVGEQAPPMSPELRQAREEFFQLFPELRQIADFFGQNGEGLANMIERAPELLSSTDQGWRRHAGTALGTIYGEMSKDLGVEKIEPNSKQGQMLGKLFMTWLDMDEANKDAYVSQAPQDVAGLFLADLRGGLLDPFRRVAQAGSAGVAAGNARLPRTSGGGGAGAGTGGAGGTKPTEDQIHHNAFETMKQIVAGNRR